MDYVAELKKLGGRFEVRIVREHSCLILLQFERGREDPCAAMLLDPEQAANLSKILHDGATALGS